MGRTHGRRQRHDGRLRGGAGPARAGRAARRPHLRALPGPALHRRVRRLLQARQPGLRAPARLSDRDHAVAAHPGVRPPDDRAARDARHAQLAAGGHVSVRAATALQRRPSAVSSGARGRARGTTRLRRRPRRHREPARRRGAGALRRVATLVAKGAPPAEIFAGVACEVRALLRGRARRASCARARWLGRRRWLGAGWIRRAAPDVAAAVARRRQRHPHRLRGAAPRSSSRAGCGA